MLLVSVALSPSLASYSPKRTWLPSHFVPLQSIPQINTTEFSNFVAVGRLTICYLLHLLLAGYEVYFLLSFVKELVLSCVLWSISWSNSLDLPIKICQTSIATTSQKVTSWDLSCTVNFTEHWEVSSTSSLSLAIQFYKDSV